MNRFANIDDIALAVIAANAHNKGVYREAMQEVSARLHPRNVDAAPGLTAGVAQPVRDKALEQGDDI